MTTGGAGKVQGEPGEVPLAFPDPEKLCSGVVRKHKVLNDLVLRTVPCGHLLHVFSCACGEKIPK